MAKKKDEKDVLVVRDEKTGEISVVAGLNADGFPKRIPAKAENSQSFLQFDRHGDVLDNFFKNFFRQCKEPSRFGFYRVAADQADKLLEVIKDLLKDPDGNKELLAPHKVDTSGYEKKVQEEQSAEKQEQPEQKQDDEPKKQEELEQKNEQNQESPQQTQGNRGYRPIDESKINWQELEEKWGVKRDDLEKSGDLDRMLNYGKSDLVRVSPNFGGEAFELDARLSFKKDGEGNVSLVPHFIRKDYFGQGRLRTLRYVRFPDRPHGADRPRTGRRRGPRRLREGVAGPEGAFAQRRRRRHRRLGGAVPHPREHLHGLRHADREGPHRTLPPRHVEGQDVVPAGFRPHAVLRQLGRPGRRHRYDRERQRAHSGRGHREGERPDHPYREPAPGEPRGRIYGPGGP